MRQMDFGVPDDGSVVVVFAETDLRTAHMIARRLSSVMRHTSHGRAIAHGAVVTVASRQPWTRQSPLPHATVGIRHAARERWDCMLAGLRIAQCSVAERSYAALRSSARLASWRRISVVPVRRSSGVSHSWKNTTFMSGRTLAAWPCWRMK